MIVDFTDEEFKFILSITKKTIALLSIQPEKKKELQFSKNLLEKLKNLQNDGITHWMQSPEPADGQK